MTLVSNTNRATVQTLRGERNEVEAHDQTPTKH